MRLDRGIEAVDQGLRAERRLDRRQGGEVCRLQRVEDKMVEVPFAHAAQAVSVCLLDERTEGGGGYAVRLEPGVQRRKIGPGDRS